MLTPSWWRKALLQAGRRRRKAVRQRRRDRITPYISGVVLEERQVLDGVPIAAAEMAPVVELDAGAAAGDGVEDLFHATVVQEDGQDALQVSVNGQVAYLGPLGTASSITIGGSSDNDVLIVHGSAEHPDAWQGLNFDAGGGNDRLVLIDWSAESVGYTVAGMGDGQVRIGDRASQSVLSYQGVESVQDSIEAEVRDFHFLGGSDRLWLSDDGVADNGRSRVSDGPGSEIDFASPSDRLQIDATSSSMMQVEVRGLDASFDADVQLAASEDSLVRWTGDIATGRGDVRVHAGEIEVSGSVRTGDAVINLDGSSRVGVAAEAILQNDGGQVSIFGGDIQHDGSITARGGEVTLEARAGTLRVSGSVDVSDATPGQTGGSVHLLGQQVALTHDARIDASGAAGGGEVLVGGDLQGGNPDVTNALRSFVSRDVSIAADALIEGDGGKVIIWADEATWYYGRISVRGGREAGDGGFVEVSGKDFLDFRGPVDAGAPRGLAGTLLLDPTDVRIVGALPPAETSDLADVDDFADPDIGADEDVKLDVAAINGATSNVVIRANRDIYVDANISIANAGTSLTLEAGDDIFVNANIATNGGDITLTANAAGALPVGGHDGTGDIISVAGVTISISGGSGNHIGLSAEGQIQVDTIGTDSGDITIATDGAVTAANLSTTGGTDADDISIVGGTIEVDTISAAGDADVSLTATAGAITDTDTDSAVTADQLSFSATAEVGGANAIQTTVNEILDGSSTGPGDITINETDDLLLTSLSNADGDVSVTAAGEITVASAFAGSANGSLSLQANDVSIDATVTLAGSGVFSVTSDVIDVSALVTANGGIVIEPLTAGTAVNLQNGVGGLNLTDTELDRLSTTGVLRVGSASAGDLTIGGNVTQGAKNLDLISGGNIVFTTASARLATTGSVTLTSGASGGVLGNSSSSAADVEAGQLKVNAGSGGVGAANALETDVDELTVTTDNANINVQERDGLTELLLNAGSGNVTLITETAGHVLSSDGEVDILGTAVQVTVKDGTFGSTDTTPGNAIEISATELSVDTASGNDNQFIRESDGLTALYLNAGNGDIRLYSGGAISDSDSNLDVIADDLYVTATTGIADGGLLAVAVDRLQASTVSGDIHIHNSGDLTIFDTGVSITGGSAADDIAVSASSPLNVNSPVSNSGGGDITLAANGATSGDDLAINSNVTASGGNGSIYLYAGDSITVDNTAVISAAGTGAILLSAGTDYNSGNGLQNGSPGGAAGNITMQDGSIVQSDAGNISLLAPRHVLLSIVDADADNTGDRGNLVVTADYDGPQGGLANNQGRIEDNLGGEAPNLIGNAATINAAGGIGESNDIDTDLLSLSAASTSTIAGTEHIRFGNVGDITLTAISNTNGLIEVNAGGTITATSVSTLGGTDGDDIRLEGTSIVVDQISATNQGDVSLTATTGSITGVNISNLITADDVSLGAVDNIGDITDFANGTGTPINLSADRLTLASITAAGGEIFVRQTTTGSLAVANDAIKVAPGVAASAILSSAGDLDSGASDPFDLDSGDSLGLESDGTLTIPDAGFNLGTGDLRLRGDIDIVDSNRTLGSLVADELGFSSGSAGGHTTLNTNVNTITASVAANNLTVNENDGLTELDLDAGSGNVTLSTSGTGDILSSDMAVDITGTVVTVTVADGDFGANNTTAGNAIETIATQLSVDTSGGNGDQFILETDGLSDLDLDAGGGNVSLATASAGDVLSADTAVDMTGSVVTVTVADGGFGDTNTAAGNAIQTAALQLTIDTTGGNGDQFIRETDGLSELNLNAGTGNVSLETTSAGNVLSTDTAVDIRGSVVTVIVADGDFGDTDTAAGNAIQTTATQLSVDTSGGNGDQFIRETDGLSEFNLNAGAGNVSLETIATGDVLSADAAVDITGSIVTVIVADGTFGDTDTAAGNAVETNATQLSVDTSGGNGDQFIRETDGLTEVNLNAGAGDVSLETISAGDVRSGDTAVDITGILVVVTIADGSFGDTDTAAGNAIQTTATELSVNTLGGNGDQFIRETDGLSEFNLNAGTGNVSLETATAGDVLSADTAVDITGSVVTVIVADGDYGDTDTAAGNAVQTTATELNVDTSGGSGRQFIRETDGLSELGLNAGTGSVSFETISTGDVLSSDTAVDLTGSIVTVIVADGMFGDTDTAAGNAIQTTATELSVNTTGGNGDQFIREIDGLTEFNLNAGAGNVSLETTSAGNVLSADTAVDITGSVVTVIVADGDFGDTDTAAGNAVQTTATELNVDTSGGTGSQFIRETDGLGDLGLNAGAGNVTLETIAVGDVLSADTAVDITGSVVTVTVAGGDFGESDTAAGNAIQTAATQLTVSTTGGNGDQFIRETDGLSEFNLNAGSGNVSLETTSAGDVLSADTAVDIRGSIVTVIVADGDFGDTDTAAGNAIETVVTELSVDTSGGNGDQFIRETNGLTDLNLNAGAGNVTLETISAGDVLSADTGVDITGSVVTITVAGGDFGDSDTAAGNAIQTNATQLTIDTTGGNGDQFIRETDGLSEFNLNAGTGNVSLATATPGDVLSADTAVDITGTIATVTVADGDFGDTDTAAGNAIETVVTELSVDTSGGNGDQYIRETDGLNELDLNAGSGDVHLELVSGWITENDPDADVTAYAMYVKAPGGNDGVTAFGIGTITDFSTAAGNPMEIQVHEIGLAETTESGSAIHLIQSGDLVIVPDSIVIAGANDGSAILRTVASGGAPGNLHAGQPKNALQPYPIVLVGRDDLGLIAEGTLIVPDAGYTTTGDLRMVGRVDIQANTPGNQLIFNSADLYFSSGGGAGDNAISGDVVTIEAHLATNDLIINEASAVRLVDVDTADGMIFVTSNGTIEAVDVVSLNNSNNEAHDITLRSLGSAGDILVTNVTALNNADVILEAGDDILDTNNTDSSILTADHLIATAWSRTDSATDGDFEGIQLNVSVVTLTASVGYNPANPNDPAGAHDGDVDIKQIDATDAARDPITLENVGTANGWIRVAASGTITAENIRSTNFSGDDAHDVTLTANGAASDILVAAISAANGADVILVADDDILDTNSSDALLISADDLQISAASETAGVADGQFEGVQLDTRVATLTAQVGGGAHDGDLDIDEGDAIELVDVQTWSGFITVVSDDTITATRVVSTNNVGGDDHDVSLTANFVGAPGQVDADIRVTEITAGGSADVILVADDDILDTDNTDAFVLTADHLVATAQSQIAAAIDLDFEGIQLDTHVNSLDASVESNLGNIQLDERDGLILTDVDTANGWIEVRAAGQVDAVDVATLTDDDSNDIRLHANGGDIVATRIAAAGRGDVLLTSSDRILDTIDHGSVLDGNTWSHPAAIFADALQLVASSGVAADDGLVAGQWLEIDVTVVAAETDHGDINLADVAGGITIGGVDVDGGGPIAGTLGISILNSLGNDGVDVRAWNVLTQGPAGSWDVAATGLLSVNSPITITSSDPSGVGDIRLRSGVDPNETEIDYEPTLAGNLEIHAGLFYRNTTDSPDNYADRGVIEGIAGGTVILTPGVFVESQRGSPGNEALGRITRLPPDLSVVLPMSVPMSRNADDFLADIENIVINDVSGVNYRLDVYWVLGTDPNLSYHDEANTGVLDPIVPGENVDPINGAVPYDVSRVYTLDDLVNRTDGKVLSAPVSAVFTFRFDLRPPLNDGPSDGIRFFEHHDQPIVYRIVVTEIVEIQPPAIGFFAFHAPEKATQPVVYREPEVRPVIERRSTESPAIELIMPLSAVKIETEEHLEVVRVTAQGTEVLVKSWKPGDLSALEDLPGLFRSLGNTRYRIVLVRGDRRVILHDVLLRNGLPQPELKLPQIEPAPDPSQGATEPQPQPVEPQTVEPQTDASTDAEPVPAMTAPEVEDGAGSHETGMIENHRAAVTVAMAAAGLGMQPGRSWECRVDQSLKEFGGRSFKRLARICRRRTQ